MVAAIVLVALTAGPIEVDYRGTLGEALNAIATKGGVNLIATGELNVPAEVHLKDVTAEEAIEALVKVHGLELHHEGKMLIVKPASAGAAAVPAAPPPPAAVAVPAVPPVPPVPPEPAHAEEIPAAAKAKAKALKNHNGKTQSTGPVEIDDGEVVEDVVSFGGSVTLGDGVVAKGDVVAFGGDVILGDGTIVDGDAVSFGGTVKKGDGAIVKGEEVSFTSGGLKPMVGALPAVKNVEKSNEKSGVAAFLINFATFFGLGFLLMMFAPNRMRNIEAEIKAEPVKSGLAGLLALIGAVPLTVLLVLTVIGIPVMVLMWLLGGLAMVMGMLALANTLGSRFPIARLRRTQAAVLASGLLVIMLLGVVPVLGPLLISAALCVSFGAIIRTRVGQRSLGLPVPESPIREVGA